MSRVRPPCAAPNTMMGAVVSRAHPQSPTPSPADVRAAVARDGRRLYLIAALADIHPAYLSSMLRGRVPLSPAVARRVLAVVRDEDAP
jgi:hypothetical protein